MKQPLVITKNIELVNRNEPIFGAGGALNGISMRESLKRLVKYAADLEQYKKGSE